MRELSWLVFKPPHLQSHSILDRLALCVDGCSCCCLAGLQSPLDKGKVQPLSQLSAVNTKHSTSGVLWAQGELLPAQQDACSNLYMPVCLQPVAAAPEAPDCPSRPASEAGPRSRTTASSAPLWLPCGVLMLVVLALRCEVVETQQTASQPVWA